MWMMFQIAVDLISRSLSRALTYVDMTKNERYIEDTRILQEGAFLEVLRSKQTAKERNHADFTLLRLPAQTEDRKKLADQVFQLLRDTDYVGMLQGNLMLLLSNSGPEEAKVAIERLQRNGVATEWMSEEWVYA
jgi:UDP-glucuronate decarboxylase